MDSSDKIILSYGDSIIRESDLALLTGPYWLNGTIISFYFEYLMKEKRNEFVLLIGPEVTQCVKAGSADEIPIFLDPLDAKNKDFILFALNDNQIYDKSGGTHWSLLIYSKTSCSIYHLDSMSGSNFRQAMKLSGKLLKYLSTTGKGEFEDISCCQQSNGYDCGIFVLYFADLLSSHLKKGTIENCDLNSPTDKLLTLRTHLSQVIANLIIKSA